MYLSELRTFMEHQIKTYQKVNHIEILFGKAITPEIFKTIYRDNSECEFAKLIKDFRNFKLSYSQGKMYQYMDYSLKTFNNKYNVTHKNRNLEKLEIKNAKYDMLVLNINKEILEEFPLHKNYNEELEYDELNVHISGDSHDQLLIFQKKGEYHMLKMELKLDLNLPYTYMDALMKDIEKVLKILEENGFTFN
jgi:hypothetical protein